MIRTIMYLVLESFIILQIIFKRSKYSSCNLKDNGEAQIIVYHKNSIFYLVSMILYDWIMKFKFLRMSLKDRRSEMEVTHSGAKALVNIYSSKEMHKICKQAGFKVIKTDVGN